jgi:hypothetical protein
MFFGLIVLGLLSLVLLIGILLLIRESDDIEQRTFNRHRRA